LKTEVLSQEKNIVVVKADFETEEVNKAVAKTIKTLSMKANIKGFRKGHVPRKTIELYFGMQGIYGETLENLLQEAIEKMVEEYDLDLIAEPDVKPGELEEGKPFTVEATFEVTPEVTLPELDKITAEKTIYTATEDMVKENIDRILEAHSDIVPLYEERTLKEDDYVSVQYTSSREEEDGTLVPVEKDVKTEIFLGEPNMRPQIKEALVGKKPGDKATFQFPIESDFENKDLAGKNMHYEIEVLGLMEKKIPELTDGTVEEITNGRHKTVEEFKANVMEQLQASAQRESDESLRNSAVMKLVEASEVEVPESLVARQKEAMRQEQEQYIKRDSGLSMEEFFEKSGMDKESYDAELESSAREIVKRSLVLEALANRQDIQTMPEELNAEIRRMAMASRVEPDKFQKFVYSDRDRMYEIAAKIRNRKAIDYLAGEVKVEEVAESKPETAQSEKEEKEAKPKKPRAKKEGETKEPKEKTAKEQKTPKASKEPKKKDTK